MSKQIAIVGAGLIGRILALQCHFAGLAVTLFDRDDRNGKESCAYTGAGMLAPYTELELAEPVIAALGLDSLALWPQLLKKLPKKVFLQKGGSLVLAHPQDMAELARFRRAVEFRLNGTEWQKYFSFAGIENIVQMDRAGLLTLESELPSIFSEGIYIKNEGQIDNKQLLDALKAGLEENKIDWQSNHEVKSLDVLQADFDVVIDCRGLGSRTDLKQLRGVRGEIIVVEATDVKLNRPIRLMHPRHPIYVVPRENSCFIVGATSIESEDMRPITVQSTLELLSAACTVHPAFAEGIIVESRTNCRPALPDNLPTIIVSARGRGKQLIEINGLYRHGFLISPKIAQLALAYIMDGEIDIKYSNLFQGRNYALSH